MVIRFICIFSLCLIIVGCTGGPTMDRPGLVTSPPASFINVSSQTNKQSDARIMARWWEQIKDPAFSAYVDILLSENLNLQEARQRVIQARERLNIQTGGNLPSASSDSTVSQSFTSDSTGDRNYFNNYSLNLNVSWAVDLFGRRSYGIKASEASYLSAAAEHEALIHTLIAELLNRRVAIAVNARVVELAKKNAANRELLFQIVRQRYNLGLNNTSLSDVYLAEENYTTVQSDIPRFQRLLAEDLYQFDLLLGRVPGSTQVDHSNFPLLEPPEQPPISIPGALLDRRPDLRASELRVLAANANVRVAIADLYPQLMLDGSLGVSGDSTRNLFSIERVVGSLIGSISQQLFSGGVLTANIRLKEATARELTTRYANDVLNALNEVETALKADVELDSQLAAQIRSLKALRKAKALLETRYRNGILSLDKLLNTQQQCYSIEQSWLITQQLRWNARISLYLALGGDWVDSKKSFHSDTFAKTSRN